MFYHRSVFFEVFPDYQVRFYREKRMKNKAKSHDEVLYSKSWLNSANGKN